jgi:hypothetical protein
MSLARANGTGTWIKAAQQRVSLRNYSSSPALDLEIWLL